MTQDEIIEMARQAGLFIAHDSEGHFSAVHDSEIHDMYPDGNKERDRLYREKRFVEILGPFAKLVDAKATAREREACAKDCEEIDSSSDYYGERVELICAEVIRARRDVVTYGEPTSRGEV